MNKEQSEEIVKWLADSEPDKPYNTTTWCRCVGIEEFVKKVEKESKIVGVIFSDNNLGFILEKLDELGGKEEKTCCVCGEKAEMKCGSCDNDYCNKHYGTTVMTGNCCSGNEKDYE